MSAAKRLLITAGPTHEPIDAVRYLANRSSGRIGVALAAAAKCTGWAVTLLLGPVADDIHALAAAQGATIHRFTTADDLAVLLNQHFPQADVLIMAAAVADYRPSRPATGKLPRQDGIQQIEVEPTPDLVARIASTRRSDQQIVAFALEQPDLLESRAAEKLKRKGVDAIVANPLSTMGSDRIKPILLTARGQRDAPGDMDKEDFADWLIQRISQGFSR